MADGNLDSVSGADLDSSEILCPHSRWETGVHLVRASLLSKDGEPLIELISILPLDSPDEEGESTTNMMGVIQAIISIYSGDGDRIR